MWIRKIAFTKATFCGCEILKLWSSIRVEEKVVWCLKLRDILHKVLSHQNSYIRSSTLDRLSLTHPEKVGQCLFLIKRHSALTHHQCGIVLGKCLIWFRFDFQFELFNWGIHASRREGENDLIPQIETIVHLLVTDDCQYFVPHEPLAYQSSFIFPARRLMNNSFVYSPLADDSGRWKVAQRLHRIILDKRFAEICEKEKRSKSERWGAQKKGVKLEGSEFIKIHFPDWWFSCWSWQKKSSSTIKIWPTDRKV